MTPHDRINDMLLHFGVYDVEGNVFVRAETEACTEGISLAAESIYELMSECFVVTARDFGLEEKESLFGSPDCYSTLDQRRERLINSLSVDETAFTPEGINRFLGSFCDDFTVTEDPSHNIINVTLGSNSRIQHDTQRYIDAVKDFFPAHLDVRVTVQT